MTTGKVKLNKGITIGVLQALLLSLSVSVGISFPIYSLRSAEVF